MAKLPVNFMKQISARSWIGILLLLTCALIIDYFNRVKPENYAQKFEKVLHTKEAEVKQELNRYADFLYDNATTGLFNQQGFPDRQLFNKRGIVYLVYQNDSLIYWSDNSAGVENYMKEVCLDSHFVKLKNGYYEIVRHTGNKTNTRQLLGLILIKNEYNYQNKYLNNSFFTDYGLPDGSTLSDKNTDGAQEIKTIDKATLFYLQVPGQTYRNGVLSCLSMFIYGIVFLLLILLFERGYFVFSGTVPENRLLFFFLFSLVAIRAVMIINHFPGIVYESALYNPSVYGNADSFWHGFLGDILINAVLIFYCCFVVQRRFAVKLTGVKNLLVFASSGILLLYSFGSLINGVINSLIHNSNISFNVTNLFSLNVYSFIGFACVAFLFFSFYLLTEKCCVQLIQSGSPTRIPMLVFVVCTLIQQAYSLNSGNYSIVQNCWPPAILALVYFMRRRGTSYTFSYGIIFIVIFSYITSHVFLMNEDRKEFDTRKVYAERLADQQDAVAENLFADISKKIKNDPRLKALIYQQPHVPFEIEQRLRQVYFSGYWERFNIGLSVLDSLCLPLIKANNPLHENNTYFDEQINLSGLSTVCPELFYIPNIRERTRYIARIPVYPPDKNSGKPAQVYLEIEPKLSPDVTGYPELLLDKSVKTHHQLSDYSYAVYKNNQLVQRYGKYAFNFRYAFPPPKNEYVEIIENEYQHLLYKFDEQTTVVVSREKQAFWDKFTTNSYFFMFFSFILLVFLYIREWNARKHFRTTSLNLRIQLLLVSVVLVSLISFGIGTFMFIKKQSESKNTVALDEKIKSVLSELQSTGTLGEQELLQARYKEYAVYILKKLSNVFAADINMFDLQGNLYASSQPRLFEEGIISRKMNPDAFSHVISGSYTNLVVKENIGLLNYYSAYQPFYNREGRLLAYINLPYFARQNELEKEISMYMVALINIYVILFAFSTLAALFISNLVTRPLRMIQQRLSKLSFGRRNEPIKWAEKDEIGSLVNEYNSMIGQLEESAEKLARSERESAWREMAKQVAHEIKNPLTPMKLSIQHLQRTIESNPDDLKERIQKLSVMLVEQIDTLSHIAGEFSMFAKMPKANVERLNIADVVCSTTGLFSETGNIRLEVEDHLKQAVFVNADKEQMVRVFTNLIKNALQAIPEGREGKVIVLIYEHNKQVLIKVKDNGVGIAPEAIDKIFVPNFSTKTEGMGLGLAMVKNIVESFGGKIWFETTRNEGTAFYVSFTVN